MPTSRPPLQVDVATRTPIRTGLGITNPGVTGGLTQSATAQAAQTTAGRVAVEVVTDVPGVLRNITPVTLGQKLASFGQGAIDFGSKTAKVVGTAFSGVSAATVGAVTAGILAVDAALFAKPAGSGSNMVNGVPLVEFKNRPKLAPASAPTLTPVLTRPQTQTQTQPKSQQQTQPNSQQQTQPLPFRPQTQPTPAPFKPQPVSTVELSEPRAPLETPTPRQPKPISKDSPYPLNLVDLDSYGGVNLTYPIAQALIEINNNLQPKLNYIETQLQEIPQTLENILKNAKIETTVTLPAKTDLVSTIPIQLDLNKQVPVNVDLSKQVPVNVDITSQIPLKLETTSQLPLTSALSTEMPISVDLRKEIPLATNFISEVPVNVGLASQIPLTVGLNSQLPVTVDLSKQVPITLDLSKKVPLDFNVKAQLPVTVDLSKKVPVALDLSALLTPDEKASGLKDLKECCKRIEENLKKKAEIFEGSGDLVCNTGTTPYSYRGEGLKGIHQLIKIVLGANKQILEKICNLETEYPLIQGSGIYSCGTSSSTPYYYSGIGFLGIQNQIEELFKIDKQILTEVCETNSLPMSVSLPDISGQIEYFDCDAKNQTILFSGNGLEGLSNQVNALATLVKVGVKAACDSGSIALMPDARFEAFNVTRQLMIVWGDKYPTQNGSLWQSYLPDPIEGLTWCKDFENLYTKKGDVYGRLNWENSKIPTGIYCESEEEVIRVLKYLATLSKATPTLRANGELKITIIKGDTPKRQQRNVRVVKAVIAEIGSDGEPSSVKCFIPPPEGCLPSII
jgi:hypothetical protein